MTTHVVGYPTELSTNTIYTSLLGCCEGDCGELQSSKDQHAHISVQAVLVDGVIDTEADINGCLAISSNKCSCISTYGVT